MRQTMWVGTQGQKDGICGHRKFVLPLLSEKGIVMRRILQGTKRLSRRRSDTSVERRTASPNFGSHYSRILLTDCEALWNKQIELCDFVLDMHLQVLLFPVMPARITQATKETWLVTVWFIDALLRPFILHTFYVVSNCWPLCVSCEPLTAVTVWTLLSMFGTGTGNGCELASKSIFKIFPGLSTYIKSRIV